MARQHFGESVTVRAPGDYQVDAISTGTKTATPLRDLPEADKARWRDLFAQNIEQLWATWLPAGNGRSQR